MVFISKHDIAWKSDDIFPFACSWVQYLACNTLSGKVKNGALVQEGRRIKLIIAPSITTVNIFAHTHFYFSKICFVLEVILPFTTKREMG